MLQPRGPNRHAVFFTHPREQVTFHYERKLYDVDGCRRADPRVSHDVTLEVDDYGNVLKSVAIGYGRRFPDPSPLLTKQDREKQARILLTLTENDYTNRGRRARCLSHAVAVGAAALRTGQAPSRAPICLCITNLFRFGELADRVAQAGDGRHDLPFEDWQATGAVRSTRPIGGC